MYGYGNFPDFNESRKSASKRFYFKKICLQSVRAGQKSDREEYDCKVKQIIYIILCFELKIQKKH